MSDNSAAIGLASASSGLPPPNSSASRFETNDHVTASVRPRTASARLALRVRVWIGVSTDLRASALARERRRWNRIDADDTHQFLDDIGACAHIGTP